MNLLVAPINNIGHLIPQKEPFVMVDRLLYFSEKSIESGFTVVTDNIFYNEGLFTEPGVVEHMAQTVALHTGYDYYRKGEDAPTGYIGSIKKVIIERLPVLGEQIRTKAEILHEFMGVTMVAITVYDSDNTVIASGEMKTVIAQ